MPSSTLSLIGRRVTSARTILGEVVADLVIVSIDGLIGKALYREKDGLLIPWSAVESLTISPEI